MNFGGGSSQTPIQTTTATKDPWSGAAPYLSSMYATAEGMRQGNQGYQPWTGPTMAPITGNQSMAESDIANMAMRDIGQQGGTPEILNAISQGNALMSQEGLTGRENSLLPQYRNIYNLGATYGAAPEAYYKGVMNQAQGNPQNPYLQDILNAQNRQIGDRVNASMSGAGRYGSGAHTDVMTRALAEAEAPILAQDYEARQARGLQSAGALSDLARNEAALMGAGTQGEQSILNQGAQRMGQWAQLMPELDQAKYAPANTLLDLGRAQTARDQQQLNSQIQLYNAQQAYPWEQLNRENAVIGAGGGLGGTTVTGVSQAQAPLQNRLLGGALAGAGIGSAFGPWGAPIGAAGGGLLGLLS